MLFGSSLPFDIWSTILGFLEVSDLHGSMLGTNKHLRSIVDQEGVYEQMVKRKFP